MTSRQLVYDTLEFNNKTGRVPRQMWVLPWAQYNHPNELSNIEKTFPNDINNSPYTEYAKTPKTEGVPFEIGEYTDNWGCRYTNIHRGIAGEVKNPIVVGEEWEDVANIHIPYEELTFNADMVNSFCKNSDQFIVAGACPKPFEQLQYIRGSENLYMDLVYKPDNMMQFIKDMHTFYCELLEKWAKTDVDALMCMDDWGAQNNLLISPDMWVEIFKPLYKDYFEIAKRHNKKMFMHSDGFTLDIYPHLIEIGLDALNSQIFCIGVDNLKEFAGQITFWGEIDRQHILPFGSTTDVKEAVKSVYENLWKDGGCIAQCEFGPGAKPENVYAVFEEWNKVK